MSITWWRGHCTTCFIYVCNMSRSHVWHDSFSAFPTNCTIYQFSQISTWPIHMYNMTHPHVWLDPNLGVLHQQHNLSIFRDIHMTHPYVLHGNVGGRGRERPKKKKLPLLKKDKKNLVGDVSVCYRITGTRFPYYMSWSTIWWAQCNVLLLVQTKPKNGFETQNVENGIR